MPILFEYETVEENFILATELGLDFVELNLNFSYCRKEMEEGKIPELLKKYPLQITLHFYDEADLGSYPEVVEGYLKLLERYASLGEGYVRMMNFHNNGGPLVTISGKRNYVYEKEYDSYIKRLIPAYTKAKEICEKRGIKLVIENTDTCPGATFLKDVYRDEMNAGFHFNYLTSQQAQPPFPWTSSKKPKRNFSILRIAACPSWRSPIDLSLSRKSSKKPSLIFATF